MNRVYLKQSCVSLIVLAALMGPSVYAMERDDEGQTSPRVTPKHPLESEVPFNHPFLEKHKIFVKAPDEATQRSVLTLAFRIAGRLKLHDRDCKELIPIVESFGVDRENIFSEIDCFIKNGMNFYHVKNLAEAVRDAGKDRHEICTAALELHSVCGKAVDSLKCIKAVSRIGERYGEVVRTALQFGFVTETMKNNGFCNFDVLVEVKGLGPNSQKI